jgi:hypothetical protein
MRLLRWITLLLTGPRAWRGVIFVAFLLAIPSIFVPLVADEHLQATLWRTDSSRFLNDCFVFASGNRAANQQQMEHGLGAWWMPPDFKVAFWRPLSAATHALDLSLWPGNATLMHLHTLVWFLALIGALFSLYRRLLTPRVTILALALYAWDDARGGVLSWVANRSALVAGLFGIFVLIAHDKWRRDGWRPGAWLAPLLLALGLLSGEMAIAVTGFLFGHALFLDRGALVLRLARLTPYLVVVTVWQVVCAAEGFGVEASGSYVHPLHEPLTYAMKLIERAPILSFGQLTPIAADFWVFYPPAVKVVVFLVAVAVLVIVARVGQPHLADNPQAGFWLMGAGLSLAPISAAGPGDRNLVFVGFGMAAALAIVFAGLVDNPPASRWPRFVVFVLAVFNLALAPLMFPLKCLANFNMDRMRARTDESVPRDAAVSQKTLVVVSAPSEAGIFFAWSHRDAEGIPKPGRTRLLATSLGSVSVTRLDRLTLRVRPDNGFLATEVHQMLRSPSRPFRAGDAVELSNMIATVIEITTDGRPRTVDFRFTAPLESNEWLWMRGAGFHLVKWIPPVEGETVVVPAPI